MGKTILITGSTDGIGLLAAKMLAQLGHDVLLHGRSPAKLDAARAELGGTDAPGYIADLSRLADVETLATQITRDHAKLDVLINNAGIYKTRDAITPDGFDIRFMVNTLAPYDLTRRLLPVLGPSGRVINLSSAAQAPVDPQALLGKARLGDMDAYAQSKLAITIWTREMAKRLPDGPMIVAINPGSLLASKMVKEGFGVAGNDLNIGADILRRAALDAEFAQASGKYFDNDTGQFADPHAAALDENHSKAVMAAIETALTSLATA